MSSAHTATYITPEDYLAAERVAETKSEWIDGEIREMAGGTYSHDLLAGNIFALLWIALRGRPFVPHSSDMRVRIPDGPYYYPDVSVNADPPELEDEHRDVLLNPCVVFEVLSPSTESIDRGKKLDDYRFIRSLTDYVLVAQNERRLDHYRRDGGGWRLDIITEPEAPLCLPEIGCELPLAEIYDRVFPAS